MVPVSGESQAVVAAAVEAVDSVVDKLPVIEVRDAVKRYGVGDASIFALNGVSLTIEPGEYVAIMGPSGSGKSTLMNILGALDNMTSGKYFLDGIEISSMDEIHLSIVRGRKIGFIFQLST